MQDNAPGHVSRATTAAFAERNIHPIHWPPYSPDLNPIESVWNIMKDHIQENYPEKMSYVRLKQAVIAAWNAVEAWKLDELIDSMHDRCLAVIDAQGQQIKY